MAFLNSDLIFSRTQVYKPQKEVVHLFASSASRTIAQTFLGIFSSVYIYESFVGYGASRTESLIFIVFYFLTYLASKLLFLSAAEDMSRSVGFKGMIWLSALPFAIFIPSLIFASRHPLFFFLAAISYGMHSGFFWWGYHGYFIKAGDRKHFGEGLGEAGFLNTLAIMITPLLGGVLINFAGFATSFVVAGLFVFLSLLLLGKGNDRSQHNDVLFSEVIKLSIKHRKTSVAYAAYGIEATFYVFGWPIFLFLLFGGVVQLGAFVTISAILAAVAGVFIGKVIDTKGERGIVALASPLMSFSWLIKAVSQMIPVFVVAESIRNFGVKMLDISLVEMSYKKAIEASTARAMLFREFNILIGSMFCLIVFGIWIYIGFTIQSFFVFVGISALLPLVWVYGKRK
jgi:hypothetical protein